MSSMPRFGLTRHGLDTRKDVSQTGRLGGLASRAAETVQLRTPNVAAMTISVKGLTHPLLESLQF